MEKVFTRTNLIHAVSGASGSALSLTLFYPLDSLRTRLQVGDNSNPWSVLHSVVTYEGAFALYNGWLAVITSITASNFVYFYTYTAVKALYPANTLNPVRDLIAAILAGCTNVLITTPLWVANTRLKLRDGNTRGGDSGLLECLVSIASREGFRGLWSGTTTSLMLVAAPSLHFVVYEALKRWGYQVFNSQYVRMEDYRDFCPNRTLVEYWSCGSRHRFSVARFLQENPNKELPGSFIFLASGAAKFLSTLMTYPLQVIQSRMRAGRNEDSYRKSAIWILRLLLQQNGILGLYKGFETKILQTVLTTAFMFLFYEKLLAVIRLLIGQK